MKVFAFSLHIEFTTILHYSAKMGKISEISFLYQTKGTFENVVFKIGNKLILNTFYTHSPKVYSV